MEVIGAVSSVLALVETTSKLAKGLSHLAKRWHNAPEEMNALANATKQLATKFAYVEDTITKNPTTLIDDVSRYVLLQLVAKASAVNSELEALRAKLEAYDMISQRARWAAKDAKNAKTILATVKDAEEELLMWISFISFKGHSLTLQQTLETQQILTVGFAEMRQMLSTMTIAAPLPVV